MFDFQKEASKTEHITFLYLSKKKSNSMSCGNDVIFGLAFCPLFLNFGIHEQ
uniref:Uncharacterized protein n=1 Tax=Arundo donax TaxID=35708 RepID=A0A0A9EHD7_ARUDO